MYGLNIFSPIHFDLLPITTNSRQKSEINIGSINAKKDVPPASYFNGEFEIPLNHLDPNCIFAKLITDKVGNIFHFVFYYVDKAARFTFNNRTGNITIDHYGNTAVSNIKNFLFHPILMFIARIRGKICLHANVMVSKDSAFAIMGSSGTGKSTLTLSLWRKGLSLLAEDVCALSNSEATIITWRGIQKLRLYPDELTDFNESIPPTKPIFTDGVRQKIYFDKPEWPKAKRTNYPLKTLFVLKKRNPNISEVQITKLSKVESIMHLLGNLSGGELGKLNGNQTEFLFLTEMVNMLDVYSVECPDDKSKLEENSSQMINFLETNLGLCRNN